MRGGMERPDGGDIRLRCPLFLFDRETAVELENLLRDLRGGGYTPLSLRELFRCRRGLRAWPPRPCAILLREVPFAVLQDLLPLLDRWETPVGVFCRAPYSTRESEALRASRWMRFYGEADAGDDFASLLPDGREQHIAAFCEVMDARTAGFLREKCIWMAVTATLPAGGVPGGVDLLYALSVHRGNRLPELLARWYQALTEKEREIGVRLEEPGSPAGLGASFRRISLPLAAYPPATALPVAAYLSILGNTPEVQAVIDWNPVFDPCDGSYCLCPSGEALTERPLAEAAPEALLHTLEEGSYPLLRSRAFPSRGLLLFGYDGERDVFLGMGAQPSGEYERVDFRSNTLGTDDEDRSATRLTPNRSKLSLPRSAAKAWADAVTGDPPAGDDLLHEWHASVAFVNRVCGGGEVSAASLRAFLEERLFNASRLRYLCERENLYTEPTDRYFALLETEGKPALQALREQAAAGENILPGLGPLFRRMLNTEEICRRKLSEGLDRMQELRTFQAEKTAKGKKMF